MLPSSSPPSSSSRPSSPACSSLPLHLVYVDPLISLAPTSINLTRVALQLDQNQDQLHQIFTSAYLRAASIGDSDLLEWLLSSPSSKETLHHPNRTSTPNLSASLSSSAKKSRAFSFSDPSQSISTPHPSHYRSSTPKTILLPGQPRKWINLHARDEDGSPAIILAAAFGHAEAVRAIVDGLGEQAVNSRDAVGWTALHWAARNGDLTIVSYLLNHGASTALVSFTDRMDHSSFNLVSSSNSPPFSASNSTFETDLHSRGPTISNGDISISASTAQGRSKRRKTRSRGLRPYDLTKHDEEGEVIRQLLQIAEQTHHTSHSGSRPQSRASLCSIRLAEARSEVDLAKSESNKIIELARLCSKTLDIDPTLLGLSKNSSHQVFKESTLTLDSGQNCPHQDVITGLLASLNSEWEEEQQSEEFHWDRCEPDQMLVCSMEEIPRILEAVIKTNEPRQARADRFVPANILFLYARFAAHLGTLELLEELLLGAVDLIEGIIFARQDNMANSTFWLFNAICLLYYVRRDPLMKELTLEIQMHLEDLINEIYVFIIRDAEKRLDKLIDEAILDFESLPDLDVNFEPEGSWRFVRALTVKRNRTSSSRLPIPGFNKSPPKDNCQPTPLIKPSSSSPNVGSPSGHGTRTTSLPNRSTSSSPSQIPAKTPISVIDLLSSVLYLLQAYEIHGSVIVQILSQILYWLSCEMFNRIISKRKYLCRSKAKQIELNLATVEEWVKLNRLPINLIYKHFEPLKHLLKWIQLLSTINGTQPFDQLIESISTLKTLNPAQLLKVSRDYRFEIHESKLEEECRQYLVQTQQDWDRRRIQKVNQLEEEEKRNVQSGAVALGSGSGGGEDQVTSPNSVTFDHDQNTQSYKAIEKDEGLKKAIKAVDLAFESDDYESYATYDPPMAPECLGELLDSRQMLPFALPTSNEVLMKLKTTVPFGSIKSYLIRDLPKPGKDWTNLAVLSDDDEEEDTDLEQEEVTKEDEPVDRDTTPTTTTPPSNFDTINLPSLLTPRSRRKSSNSVKLDQNLTTRLVVPVVSSQVLKRIDLLVSKPPTY